jgi:phage FluMu protein Com
MKLNCQRCGRALRRAKSGEFLTIECIRCSIRLVYRETRDGYVIEEMSFGRKKKRKPARHRGV